MRYANDDESIGGIAPGELSEQRDPGAAQVRMSCRRRRRGTRRAPGANGCPILEDALGYLECRVAGELPAGDHTVFVGEIVEAGVLREGEALTMRETGFRYSG